MSISSMVPKGLSSIASTGNPSNSISKTVTAPITMDTQTVLLNGKIPQTHHLVFTIGHRS